MQHIIFLCLIFLYHTLVTYFAIYNFKQTADKKRSQLQIIHLSFKQITKVLNRKKNHNKLNIKQSNFIKGEFHTDCLFYRLLASVAFK